MFKAVLILVNMLFQSLRLRITKFLASWVCVQVTWTFKKWSKTFIALSLSPPQRLPLGIPIMFIKIAIIEKIESAQGTKAGASLLSFPFPSCLGRSLFLSPQPPHNTKRPLWRREALTPKILVLRYCEPVGVWWEDRILYPMNDKSKLRVVISKQIFFFSWTECHRYPWQSHGWSSTRPSKQRKLTKPFCSQ